MQIRIIFSLLIALVTTGLIAQGGFQRTYQTAAGDTIFNMQDATSTVGQVVTIGFRQFEEDRQALVIATLDMKGNIKWQTQLDMGRDTAIIGDVARITFDSDQDSLLFSFSAEINGEVKELFGRMTSGGSGTSIKSIDGAPGDPNYISGVAALFGSTDLILRSGEQPTLARIGSGDELIWSQRFRMNDDAGTEQQTGINYIAGTADSTILLCDLGPLQRGIVAELDSNGTQIWAESYGFAGISATDVYPSEAINLNNKMHAVVGYYASLPMDTNGFVMILDTLGQPILATRVQIGGNPTIVSNVIQQTDGSLWISGTYSTVDSVQYFTANMTTDGIANWATTYPAIIAPSDPLTNALFAVDATTGAALVGKKITDNMPELNVMVHNNLGETAPDCAIANLLELTTLTTVADTIIFSSENGGLFFSEFVIEEKVGALITPPVLSINDAYQFCPNEPVDTVLIAVVDGVEAITYQWGNENGIIQGATDDTLRIMMVGQYSVTVTIAEDVCYTMCDTIEVKEYGVPTASIAPINCNTQLITAGMGGKSPYTFVWSTGDTSEVIDIDQLGTYSVTVTDECGSTGTFTRTIEESELVVTWGQNNSSLCTNEVITLTGGATGFGDEPIFTWSDGQIGEQIFVSELGQYSLTVTDECDNSATFTDIVLDPDRPTSAVIDFEVNCDANKTVQFSAVGNEGLEVDVFLNRIVDGISTSVSNPLSPKPLGEYIVTVSDPLCENEIESLTVNVSLVCGVFDYPKVFFPGAGGAPEEDVFGPIPSDTLDIDRVTDFEFRVFNRFGEMVYETNEVLSPWDGNRNGNPAPSEVYIWYATYKVDGVSIEAPEKGDITLVR